ncbi:uncharacterized protein F4807DRAFT_426792 [Annulohypoxylon truncatum]|uniref:uncharacterized protein n=1 Tax=Annulohypoxylon truncatum TaxID=327061 RepID=UPI00200874DD|nr:uncharacterized protein F4807DRAFT_426792 [Annulohypoxylon truncatum]KAI1209468.1 hypothetical protein F4807DRAFT_426792 [Annulohypoxylon truncatum]
MPRAKSKERSSTRKVTPPSPTYMNNDQFAAYLANLRDNRVTRPGGARPLPQPTLPRHDSTARLATERVTAGRPSLGSTSLLSEASSNHMRAQSDSPRPRGSRPSFAPSIVSRASRYSTLTSATGRDYYPENPATAPPPLKPGEVVPSATYMERGQRWMEKEEAVSIRDAMDVMDAMETLKLHEQDKGKQPAGEQDDEESRLYNAALDEAAELVWQHQHGVKPPEPGAPYRYKPHLRKDSYAHARTASSGRYGSEIGATGLARDSIRSFSGSSSSSERAPSPESARNSMDQQRTYSMGSQKSKSYGSIGSAARSSSGGRRLSSLKRNISGEIEKPFSGDQIWEEPESTTPERNPRQPRLPEKTQPLGLKSRGVPNRVQFAPTPTSGSVSPEPSEPAKPISRFEIHKNPPSQSRNPAYTTNSLSNSPRSSQESIPKKNGMEIRSDDIKQATSMRLKDRSAKLPTPSAVSDSPGRPIVSFDKNWKPPEKEATDSKLEESKPSAISQRRVGPFGVVGKERAGSQSPQPSVPAIAVTEAAEASKPSPASRPSTRTPSVPSIQVDGADDGPKVPVISVSGDGPAVPKIMLPDDDSSSSKAPGVPTIVTPDDNRKPSARPLPDPKASNNARGRPRSHWSPAPGVVGRRASAICHECGLPIEGRFVALAGNSERFHPQCFRCYACGTALEALEISPEPDNFRNERLDRIRRRAAGEILDEEPGQTMAEDGDERLRFYCHLDWHELFAPRCKHCKTPILGEHVVALGAHWHYGHFFCAECGDPFEQGATHIEKDGYAWCINCQTKRTERRAPKCKGCRTAVIGQYVRALGGEWHEECFRCATCGGGFDDGQIFPMKDRGDMVVLCTACRSAELKM